MISQLVSKICNSKRSAIWTIIYHNNIKDGKKSFSLFSCYLNANKFYLNSHGGSILYTCYSSQHAISCRKSSVVSHFAFSKTEEKLRNLFKFCFNLQIYIRTTFHVKHTSTIYMYMHEKYFLNWIIKSTNIWLNNAIKSCNSTIIE